MVARGSLLALYIRGFRIGCLIIVYPQEPFNSPEDAANRAPHHGADGAGASIALIDAMGDTAGYSLSVCGERNRECSDKCACDQDLSFHPVEPLF